uniref:Uncharacterized protein n=1 Tax=Eutreptiella gymnastica TaxID=73025 RepID=A0A7S4GKX2_9EUGL
MLHEICSSRPFQLLLIIVILSIVFGGSFLKLRQASPPSARTDPPRETSVVEQLGTLQRLRVEHKNFQDHYAAGSSHDNFSHSGATSHTIPSPVPGKDSTPVSTQDIAPIFGVQELGSAPNMPWLQRQHWYIRDKQRVAAFQREPGLQRLRRIFANMVSGKEEIHAVTHQHLVLPSQRISFQDFLASPPTPYPINSPPARLRYNIDGGYMWHRAPDVHLPFYPYIHILSFFKICDFVWAVCCEHYCNHSEFDARTITNRSLVYWQQQNEDVWRLEQRLPLINAHFFLMAHEVDNIILTKTILESPKILKIFAVHCNSSFYHPKVIPLPLGISKDVSYQLMEFDSLRSTVGTPSQLLQALFTMDRRGSVRHHRRIGPLRFMKLNNVIPKSTNPAVRMDLKTWVATMKTHKYQASPSGSGLDAYRTWETLVQGRVPVVPITLPRELFDELPVIRQVWHNISERSLMAHWESMQRSHFNFAQAWMPWWVTYILLECLAIA